MRCYERLEVYYYAATYQKLKHSFLKSRFLDSRRFQCSVRSSLHMDVHRKVPTTLLYYLNRKRFRLLIKLLYE